MYAGHGWQAGAEGRGVDMGRDRMAPEPPRGAAPGCAEPEPSERQPVGRPLAFSSRAAAAEQARRVLPALPMPLDAIARLAARLLDTPTGLVTVVGDLSDDFVGAYGLPPLYEARRCTDP